MAMGMAALSNLKALRNDSNEPESVHPDLVAIFNKIPLLSCEGEEQILSVLFTNGRTQVDSEV
jgi:hypothetical protein